MMKIIYWARLRLANAEVSSALRAVPGADVVIVEHLPDLLAALPGATGLVLYDAPPPMARQVTAAVEAQTQAQAQAGTLRWMHFLTAGREGFEAAGLPRGVQITWPAGAVSPSVAEHAMALLLAMTRRVPAILHAQASRNWDRIAVSDGATTLEDARLVIVGFGQIGREVARRARGFGAVTVGVSRRAAPDPLLDESHALADLPAVLGGADFVVLSLALTDETANLFDAPLLAACRRGAYLVNVARGGLIDQAALADALRSGHLAGVGLDVVDPEPLPADDPLWQAPNLILSPHFSGSGSAASRRRLADGAAANLRRLIAGEALHHRIDTTTH